MSVITPSVGKALLERTDGAWHQALRMPGMRSVVGLELGGHDGKQRDRRHAERHAHLGVTAAGDRPTCARCRAATDRFFAPRSVEYEHRVDEVVGSQPMLARQAAREVVAAQPARPARRETAGECERHASPVLRMTHSHACSAQPAALARECRQPVESDAAVSGGQRAQAQQQLGGRERVARGIVARRACDAVRVQPVIQCTAALARRRRGRAPRASGSRSNHGPLTSGTAASRAARDEHAPIEFRMETRCTAHPRSMPTARAMRLPAQRRTQRASRPRPCTTTFDEASEPA